MKQPLYDLGWGESVVVRHRFLECTRKSVQAIFDHRTLLDVGYSPIEGDPELIEITKSIIKRQTGREYDYVLPTHGAAGGVTLALRAYKNQGYYNAVTAEPPYFAFYPNMIKASGLQHVNENIPITDCYRPLALIDSPSNPLGQARSRLRLGIAFPIVWDAVYHNKVYVPDHFPVPDHDVVVGSYSKLTGINGIRIGWLATNEPFLYERAKMLAAEYGGLSSATTQILLNLLKDFYWDEFETMASNWLDYNREEWSKLEKYFDKPVTNVGMFHYSKLDKHVKTLLEKSHIKWTLGSLLGTSDDFGRFNLGQDAKMIKKAVQEVLKNDKSRRRS